jgi:hypothetical protein
MVVVLRAMETAHTVGARSKRERETARMLAVEALCYRSGQAGKEAGRVVASDSV